MQLSEGLQRGFGRGLGCNIFADTNRTEYLASCKVNIQTTVHEAQKQQLEQPQTPNLFWPSNILAMTVKSSKGLSFEEQMTLC